MTKNQPQQTKAKFLKWLTSLAVIMLLWTTNVWAALTVSVSYTGTAAIATGPLAGPYSDLATAITDLNGSTFSGSGDVTLTCSGGPETAPAGGYVIQTVSGGPGLNIVIDGGNQTVTAFTPQTAGAINDAIFKIKGSDYITIKNFTMTEDPANSTTTLASNNMTEWGVALLYASLTDGAKNNTIQSNTISLNRTYLNTFGIYSNTRHADAAPTTTAEVTSAGGSNSNNKVYANNISNVNVGIVFIGAGTTLAAIDDGNDIGGTSLATGNTITNWGGGSAASAYVSLTTSNYCIFVNQQINDNVSFNTITSGSGIATTTVQHGGVLKNYSVASPGGTITTNINNNTVTLTNSPTTGQMTGVTAQGMTALSTATINMNNNLIANCAITGASATSAAFVGVFSTSAPGTLNMNGNTIRGITTNSTTGGFIGIAHQTNGVVNALNINNNKIGDPIAGAVTYTNATSSGTFTGITVSAGGANCAITITSNDFRGIDHTTSGTGAQTYIINTAVTTSQVISSNTFTNLNIKSTGSVTFISNSVSLTSSGSKTSSNNQIVTAFNKANAGGTITFFTSSSFSVNGSTNIFTNNNFSNITVTGATTIAGWSSTEGNTSTDAPNKTFTGNTFNNITGGTNGVTIATFSFGGANSTITGNTISNITGQGAVTGLALGGSNNGFNVSSNSITNLSSTGTGGTVTGISSSSSGALTGSIASNTINTLSSTGASSTITGVLISGGTNTSVTGNTINTLTGSGITSPICNGISVSGGTTINVTKNKIYNLTESAAIATTSGAVNGILMSGGTTVNVINNLIGDLFAPAANLPDAIRAISVTSTTASTSYNVYNNSIVLGATSTGANFGTTGVFHTANATATTAKLDLRNNLIINTSSQTGTGITSVFRRSVAATYGNWATTSNNNLISVGALPFSATRTILNDAGTIYPTAASSFSFANYKSQVAARDAASFTSEPAFTYAGGATPFFVSTVGSNASYLKPNPGNTTQVEGGAAILAAVTDDYSGTAGNRATSPDVGAWEFAGLTPQPVITLNSSTPGLTSQCSASARLISIDVQPSAGTTTSVTITYNNGAAVGPVSMTNTVGTTWTYTIPAASPTNTVVTWSVTATNSLAFTKTYIGATYQDDPLNGLSVGITANPNPVCASNPTTLTASLLLGSVPSAPAAGSYCASTHSSGCGSGDEITNVTLNTLVNPSGCGAGNYTYFSGGGAQTTTISPSGSPYNLSVSFGSDGSQFYAAWIDYNHDGVYSSTEMIAANSTTAGASGTSTLSFTVPATAYNGLTHMRIVGGNDAIVLNTQACGASSSGFGETEDYDITITGASASPLTVTAYDWNSGGPSIGSTNPLIQSPSGTTNYTAILTASGCQITSAPYPVNVSNAPPSTQASNLASTGASFFTLPLSWTNGNGVQRVVFMNTSNSFVNPVDGVSPTANSVWSGSGPQCIYNGTGNSVTVSGLTGGTTYWFRVYEANCAIGYVYNVNTGTNNPASFSTQTPLDYVVTRTTGNAYQSIAPIASGGDGSGTLSTAGGDETTQTGINIAGINFSYQNSPVTSISIHPNGYIVLNNGLYSYTGASSWDNTLASNGNGFSGTSDFNKRNVIAPFYDDLNKASPVIYYKISGSKLTVEWFNSTFFGLSGPQLFFQVVLDGSDESITFNYGNMQLYNGTQNIRYSYTCGLSGASVSNPATQGQIMQQQYENTTYFTHENSGVASWGANGLSISPAPRSSIKFTPGTYVAVAAPGSTPPSNDEPGGAVERPALTAFPSNIAWDNGTSTSNLYTTRYATTSAIPNCGGSASGKDVWFYFTANNPDATVRIYASGGFIPRVQVYDQFLVPVPSSCQVGTQGLIVNSILTGLNPGDQYYVRVYHENTGTQATATATVSSGVVTALTVNPGTNYSVPATAYSGYVPQNQGPRISFSGGGGVGAAAGLTTPTATTQVLGSLAGSNLSLSGGSGYTSAPTVTIEQPDWGITGEFGIVIFAKAANDECATATTLTNLSNTSCVAGQNSRIGVVTTAATASADVVCGGTPDDDVWYKFVATAAATYIKVDGNNGFDPQVEVWDGGVSANCGTKTTMTCQNLTGTDAVETIAATTIPGNTYFLRVYHSGTGSGAIGAEFDICVSNTAPIDAAASIVYSLGKNPLIYGDNHVVQARIINTGGFDISNLSVTLNVTGANTFSDVQIVPSILTGDSATVSFAPFTATNLGANVLTVTVPSDENNTNNSATWDQVNTPNLFSYKSPSQSNVANDGVGFNGGNNGDFVAKIPINGTHSINEVEVDFGVNPGSPFQIGIWSNNAGVPGTLLYNSPTYFSSVGTPSFVPISPALSVTGDVFVGVRQFGGSNVGFAYQVESPVRAGTYFYETTGAGANSGPITPSGTWVDFASFDGEFRFAISVQIETPIPPNCAVGFSPANLATAVCPLSGLSWASGGGGPTSYDLYFSTNQTDVTNLAPAAFVGNFLTTSTTVPLTASTTYYWSVIAKNINGDATGCSVNSFTTAANESACYCIPSYTSGTGSGDFISLVNLANSTLNSISAGASSPYYTLYPQSGSTTASVAQNYAQTLTVKGGTFSTCFIRGWIDYNHNGVFEATETIGVSPNVGASTTGVINFTIPVAPYTGSTRMRLRSSDTSPGPSPSQACGATNSGFGETEDYIITIDPEPTNPPSCIASYTVNNACITQSSISWQAATGYPLGYYVTVYDVPTSTYLAFQTDVGNNLSFNLPALTPSTAYNYVVEPYNNIGTSIGCSEATFTSGASQSVTPNQTVNSYKITSEGTTPPALLCGLTTENYDGLGTSVWYTSTSAPFAGLNHLAIDKNPDGVNALDDWFFSPPINVVAGRVYRLTWYDRIGSGSTAESYRVYIAPSADATTMSGTSFIYSGSTSSTTYALRSSTDYLAASNGQIHFGFRATSPAGPTQTSLYLDDIQITEIPVSSLVPGSCTTIPSMYDQIFVQPVLGATNYRFKIVGTGAQSSYNYEHYRNNANIDYRLKWAPGVIYGYTYNVSVAYYKNATWSPYGASCPVTLGPFPASKLRNNPSTVAGPCDYVISDLNQQLFADSVSGSNDYMYKIVEDVPGGPYDYDHTWQRYSGNLDYRLVWGYQASPLIERVQYGYKYDVQVRSLVGKTGTNFGSRPGEWGPYGTTCKLDLTAASPITSLTTCGVTLTSLNDQIFTTPVSGATNYQYEITGPGYFNTAYRNNGNNDFRLIWVPSSPAPGGVSYATTYSIRVRAYVGGIWLNYGPSCNVTTPAAPVTSVPALCGATLTTGSFSTLYSATAVPGATQYAFRFTNVGGVAYSKIIYNYSANNTFTLSRTVVCCGYQNMLPNAQYTVEVAYFAGTWSAFGPACTFTTGPTVPRYSPFNSEATAAAAGALNLAVYPNPASVNEQYSIQLDGITAANEKVEVRIFNLLGDKVYNTTVVTQEESSIFIKPEVQLAAGVYMAEAQFNGNVTRVKFVVK